MNPKFGRKIWLLRRKLVPPEEVAGIDITDAFARLILLDPGTLNITAAAEVKLLPGTVRSGRVESHANLVAALQQLKTSAGTAFSHNPVAILSLSPELFFTHVLSLPDIPEENFKEAARLNAIQLSPIKMQEAYFDWQNLGVDTGTLERELFIAVAPRAAIDPYLEAARRAGIDIIAAEPSSLGLVRVLTYFVTAPDKRAAFLLASVSSDGMDFVVAREGKPFFSHFFSWKDVPEARAGRIDKDGFKTVTRRGISKVLMFFTTRHKEQLASAAPFSPIFQEEIVAVLKDEFRMKVAGYRLPIFGGKALTETWVGALGSALRGIIPRGQDTIVSLMPVGTEELFRRRQASAYVEFWGKAFAAVCAFFIVVFSGLFALSANVRQDVIRALAVQQRSEAVIAAGDLTERAEEFNAFVENVLQAELLERSGAQELSIIAELAGERIEIQQIILSIEGNHIQVRAFALNRREALEFKNRLDVSGRFSKVDFPLAFVREVPGGVEFAITAIFK